MKDKELMQQALADELWEKYLTIIFGDFGPIRKNAFIAALKEYGEAVREKAAGVCEDEYSCEGIAQRCATAIKQMELP